MNGCTLKGSKSSMCSPVPMKMIGLPVAATLKVKRNNSLSNVYCTHVQNHGYRAVLFCKLRNVITRVNMLDSCKA